MIGIYLGWRGATSAGANLIPGHNEIYNKSFVKFLTAYLNLYLQEKPDETPVPPQ